LGLLFKPIRMIICEIRTHTIRPLPDSLYAVALRRTGPPRARRSASIPGAAAGGFTFRVDAVRRLGPVERQSRNHPVSRSAWALCVSSAIVRMAAPGSAERTNAAGSDPRLSKLPRWTRLIGQPCTLRPPGQPCTLRPPGTTYAALRPAAHHDRTKEADSGSGDQECFVRPDPGPSTPPPPLTGGSYQCW
jgi:hypothetical protein